MVMVNPLGTEPFWVNVYHNDTSVIIGAVRWFSRENAASPPGCDIAYRLKVRPWIPHDGGPCPVAPHVRVRVRTRDGWQDDSYLALFPYAEYWAGGEEDWWTGRNACDEARIIAYQIIKEEK